MARDRDGPRRSVSAADVEGAVHVDEVDPSTSRRFSVYDHIHTPPERRSLGELAKLIHGAARLMWRAGPVPFVLSMMVQLFGGAAVLAQLLVARHVLAGVLVAQRTGGSFRTVLPGLMVLVALTVLTGVGTAIQVEVSTVMGELMSRQAARELLDVASAVDLEAYETPAFHDRLERAKLNAQTRPVMAVSGLIGVLSAGFGAIGVSAALFAIQPLVLPVAALAMFPVWLATTRNSRAFYGFAVDLTPNDRERNYVQNVLSSKDLAKEVRAFDLTAFFRARFESLYEQRLAAVRRLVKIRFGHSLAASVLSSMTGTGAIALLVWLLLSGHTSLASTGTAVLAMLYLGQRLSGIVNCVGILYESALFIDDFTRFLDLRYDVENARPTHSALPIFEKIEVEHLTFTYRGASRPALQDVCIEIRKGEVVALVGDNGSGKTTLAKHLGLLYQPDGGRILWDGVDVALSDSIELRRAITVVFQDFGRYWLSARENIGIGATDRMDDTDAIFEAARTADADAFLRSLPRGYDTVLSRLFEGGSDLSIGQWQRVSLARALFRDAPLVILDEPTASLDAMAEYRLFQVVRDVCEGRAVLLISHRFSSVRAADRIYVLDHGRVIEAGTHDELMAQQGRYAHMFSLQASAYVDPV